MADSGDQVLRVRQTRGETRSFYNRIARAYDALSESTESSARRKGIRLLKAARGESILEIGFGTGHCLLEFARATGPDGRVYGLDLAERMVELARGLLRKSGLLDRCRLRRGDAARLPYETASMDAVFMSFTLELFDVPEIPVVLAECRRVLKPGGRIVVVGMTKESEGSRLARAFEWMHRRFPHVVDCRPIYVRRALRQAGFRVRAALLQRVWVPVEIVLAVR